MASVAQQVMRDVTINSVEVTRLSNLRSEVKAYVTVTDLNGAPIKNLAKDNFAVTEDGVTISEFNLQEAAEGLWIVLVMDTTSSMHQEGLKAAKDAADRFVVSMGSADQVALYEFQEESKLLVDFTTDHNKVRNAITELELVDKWTCLYDAANTAVKKAMEIPRGRRAVVLMTDGKDTREGKPCSAVTVDDMIALAWKYRVPIYVIGLGQDIDEAVLKRIAEKTGGAYWSAPEPEGLTEAYRQVAELLQSQYTITFESTGAGGDHALVVRVDYQGQQALDAGSFLIPAVPTASVEARRTPKPGPTPAEEETWTDKLPYLLGAAVVVIVVVAFMVLRVRKRRPELFPGAELQPETIELEEAPAVVSGREEETAYVPPLEEEVTTDVTGAEFQALATLTVLSSMQLPEGESWELYGRSVTIGRGADNDIIIPDQPVSRRHAELRYQDGEFYVYDRGSRFGTQVNGVTVPPHGVRLTDGDQLQLGTRTTLRFTRLHVVGGGEQDRTQDVGVDESTQELGPA